MRWHPAALPLAMLLYLSPAQPAVSGAGPFLLAVLAAAWFGGAGPGFLAAVLATLAVPHVVTVSYPLVGGFLDVPRFIAYSIEGLAVGWWNSGAGGSKQRCASPTAGSQRGRLLGLDPRR